MNTVSYEQTYESFARKRHSLAELATHTQDVAKSLSMSKWERILEGLQQRIHSDTFKVLVIGEFSRGKSTLINALLGQEVLPSFATETTAIINEIKWGDKVQTVLHHANNDGAAKRETTPLPIEELEQYVVIDPEEDPETAIHETPYEKIEIFWPLDLCRNGVELIDSPGLNVHDARERITVNYLAIVDAVIFVMDCGVLGSRNEMNTIQGLRHSGHEDIFFVCNKFNLIRERERDRLVKVACNKLGPYTRSAENRIFFVNALGALESRLNGGEEEPTGIERLEEELATFLATERGRIKVVRSAIELRNAVREAREVLPERERLLRTDAKTLDERYREAAEPLRQLESKREIIVATTDHTLSDIEDEVRLMSSDQLRKVLDQIPEWTAEHEVENKLSFTLRKSALEQQVKDLVGEMIEYLRERFDEVLATWVAEELKPQINGRLEELMARLEPDTQQFLQRADEIRLSISHGDMGSLDAPDERPVSALERVLAGAGGLLLITPGAGLMGLAFGYKEMVKSIIPQLAIGLAVIVFAGLNPWILLPALLGGGVIQGMLRMGAKNEEIKAEVGRRFADELRNRIAELSTAIGKQVREELRPMRDALDQGLGSEIASIKEQVETVQMEQQKGQEAVDKELAKLASVGKLLLDIDGRLDAMLAEAVIGSESAKFLGGALSEASR